MTSLVQRSFAGGEIAPALYARADQQKYATGLRTCKNFKVQKHGGVASRAGFEFIAKTKVLGKKVRLLKFVFNTSQTYVLEVGDLYIRFYHEGAQIEVSGVAAWSGATTYAVGDLVVSGGINYYCILAHAPSHVPPNATYWYALTGVIYEIPTTYLEADLPDLQYVQSGDVVTITHPTYQPSELRRTGHTAWTLVPISFAASISAPTSAALTLGGAGAAAYEYVVTAVKVETYEESVASNTAYNAAGATPTEQAPHKITWVASSGAEQYNIYKSYVQGGTHGFIGMATGLEFRDTNIAPDFNKTPPVARNPMTGAGNYPGTVTYFQQRRGFASSNNSPETTWLSRSADQDNMNISYPLQEDDAVTFTLRGNQVNRIRGMIEVDAKFVILTAGGEWVIQGNASGVVTPSEINPRQIGYSGTATLRPLIVTNTALFVQARGSTVRDLRYEVASDGTGSSGYRGRDLSVFAEHLFTKYTILDWDYAQAPDSIVWAVRSDGVLLGLTYLREQEIWGWHRHDTDGIFENDVTVPEGNEDILYAAIKRTIGGVDYRYIERMHSRIITDLAVDAFFVDSGLTYDGRRSANTSWPVSQTLTGGTNWTVDELLTCTASAGFFVAGDVGNEVVLRLGTEKIRFLIAGYTGTTIVIGHASKTVPASMRGVAVTDWGKAVDDLSGLDHLEGKTVSVLGDGVVDPQKVVTSGAITLSRPYEVIHAGLPYTPEIETLDLEILNRETILDKKKRINSLTVITENSRGFWAGDDRARIKERVVNTDLYATPSTPDPEKTEILLQASWNNNGRVLIQQRDPLPLTILAVIPSGMVGG